MAGPRGGIEVERKTEGQTEWPRVKMKGRPRGRPRAPGQRSKPRRPGAMGARS